METDEMNFRILKNAASSLKSSGKFIFTCLNALFPLFHSVKEFMGKNSNTAYSGSFDMMAFREYSTYEVSDDEGKPLKLKCNERYYAPSEIKFMLELLDFKKIEIFGCDTGVFDRSRQVSVNDYELLVVAEK